MKNKVGYRSTTKALRIQIESATNRGGTSASYAGLYVAVLAIAQGSFTDSKQAIKFCRLCGITVSEDEAFAWFGKALGGAR